MRGELENEFMRKDDQVRKTEEVIEKMNHLMISKLDCEHFEKARATMEEDFNDKVGKVRNAARDVQLKLTGIESELKVVNSELKKVKSDISDKASIDET